MTEIYIWKSHLKMKTLTWISEVEVILNVTWYIFSFSVLYPVWIRFFIVTNKNPKQDDHGCLPHNANGWKTDTNISVFWTVAQFPEALYAAHCFWLVFIFCSILFCFVLRGMRFSSSYSSEVAEVFRWGFFCKSAGHFKGPEHLKHRWRWAKTSVCFKMKTLPHSLPPLIALGLTFQVATLH